MPSAEKTQVTGTLHPIWPSQILRRVHCFKACLLGLSKWESKNTLQRNMKNIWKQWEQAGTCPKVVPFIKAIRKDAFHVRVNERVQVNRGRECGREKRDDPTLAKSYCFATTGSPEHAQLIVAALLIPQSTGQAKGAVGEATKEPGRPPPRPRAPGPVHQCHALSQHHSPQVCPRSVPSSAPTTVPEQSPG